MCRVSRRDLVELAVQFREASARAGYDPEAVFAEAAANQRSSGEDIPVGLSVNRYLTATSQADETGPTNDEEVPIGLSMDRLY